MQLEAALAELHSADAGDFISAAVCTSENGAGALCGGIFAAIGARCNNPAAPGVLPPPKLEPRSPIVTFVGAVPGAPLPLQGGLLQDTERISSASSGSLTPPMPPEDPPSSPFSPGDAVHGSPGATHEVARVEGADAARSQSSEAATERCHEAQATAGLEETPEPVFVSPYAREESWRAPIERGAPGLEQDPSLAGSDLACSQGSQLAPEAGRAECGEGAENPWPAPQAAPQDGESLPVAVLAPTVHVVRGGGSRLNPKSADSPVLAGTGVQIRE
jgi:hypothetical protein